MALGAVAIALSSATAQEHSSWQEAADREGQRYGVEDEYVRAGMEGREYGAAPKKRSVVDWALILAASLLFVGLAVVARFPSAEIGAIWAAVLVAAMLCLLATCGVALWRTTRFR